LSRIYQILFFLAVISSVTSFPLIAQDDTIKDTPAVDTSIINLLGIDTLKLKETDTNAAKGSLDTLIYYGADTTEGYMESSTVVLRSNAWVRYRGMEIRAAKITIEQPKKMMIAEAVSDSSDSSGIIIAWKGRPVFTEGGESFTGQVMEYNFDTRRGKVVLGETKMQEGIYYGKVIRKIGDSTLYVRGGRFTSCEAKEPHFYFRTEQLKIEMRDQVVAKPVVLYIHEVPIFAIPYGVFPNKTGRRSGIIPPSYSETPREGKQLRNFGYYWAPNDYFDAVGQMDYLDKAGFIFRGGTRYAKRYAYSGSVQFSYSSLNYITGEKTRLWNLDATHSHTLSERSNLNADIHYVSSKNFYQFTSINQQQILNRQVRTNVVYNSSYDWGSVSTSLSQSRNLDNGQRDFTFPNVSISKSSAAIFSKPADESYRTDRWYETIRYSYNSNALRKEIQANDTAVTQSAMGMNHQVSLNAPFKVLSYINLSPNFNFQETWFDRRQENYRLTTGNRETSDTVRSFFARHTFSTGVTLSTKLYGLMNPEVFGLKTLRHVMTPSVNLTYQPDFSSRQWGYWEHVKDTTGTARKFDRYRGNILFGGSPSGRTLSMGVNLANVFQAKYLRNILDTSKTKSGKNNQEETKIDLLNWNSGISYNFEAEQFKLSTLNSSVSVSNDLAKNISLSLSMVHDFYRYDRKRNQRLDILNKVPRLLSLTITSGFSLNGGESGSSPAVPSQPSGAYPASSSGGIYGERFVAQQASLPEGVPWNARMDFNYDINKNNPNQVTRNFGVNISSGLKLTTNWQVNYTARYDIQNKKLISQSFSFMRDLHCWEMRLEWSPTGPAAGYFFIVQIKAQNLRDIKLQRTDYGSQIY
jgi:lipopolysaccharide assembly outer membrane protein LptD (OstA)